MTIEENTCSICFKKYGNKVLRRKHESNSNGTHTCRKCDQSFSSSSKLKYHIKLEHSENVTLEQKNPKDDKNDGSIVCSECGSQFNYGYNLLRHEREVHFYTDFNLDYVYDDTFLKKCPLCPVSFHRKSDLKRHQSTVHVKSDKWACEHCGIEFSRKDNLTRHLRDLKCKLRS